MHLGRSAFRHNLGFGSLGIARARVTPTVRGRLRIATHRRTSTPSDRVLVRGLHGNAYSHTQPPCPRLFPSRISILQSLNFQLRFLAAPVKILRHGHPRQHDVPRLIGESRVSCSVALWIPHCSNDKPKFGMILFHVSERLKVR